MAESSLLDYVFQQAETTRPLALRPSLWREVEAKLDHRERRKRIRSRILGIAAAVVVTLASVLTWQWSANSDYQLEDMKGSYDVFITRAKVSDLHHYYRSLQSPDLNG